MNFIFDFGGVLMDWDPRYLYRKLLPDDATIDRFLMEIEFAQWNLQQDAGRPFAQAVASHCERFPHYAELIRAYDARWIESLSGPIEPSVGLLSELHHKGYNLYGLTNWSGEKFRLARQRWPFFDMFKDIIVSGDVRLVKPDPRIFQVTLERIGAQAQDCLLIDDSAANIRTAQELGFHTLQVFNPEQLRRDLLPYLPNGYKG